MCLFVCHVLEAAITVNVAYVFFDGPLRDEGWILGVTRYLHGPT